MLNAFYHCVIACCSVQLTKFVVFCQMQQGTAGMKEVCPGEKTMLEAQDLLLQNYSLQCTSVISVLKYFSVSVSVSVLYLFFSFSFVSVFSHYSVSVSVSVSCVIFPFQFRFSFSFRFIVTLVLAYSQSVQTTETSS